MRSSALDTIRITRHAVDPRADGASRTVHVGAHGVTIERVVQGIRMRLGVPVSCYRDLVMSVRPSSGRATLKLRHDDSELDVVIGSGDAIEEAKAARAWSAVIGKAVTIEHAAVVINDPYARQRKRTKPARRSRFARGRRGGVVARTDVTFAGEREIIART